MTDLYEDVAGVTDAGALNVLYGSPTGIQTDAPPNQFWSGGSNGVQAGLESGAQFGWCTAFGDFNGDGFSDLGVCVPYQDVNVPASQWFTTYWWRFSSNNGAVQSGQTGWSSFYRSF